MVLGGLLSLDLSALCSLCCWCLCLVLSEDIKHTQRISYKAKQTGTILIFQHLGYCKSKAVHESRFMQNPKIFKLTTVFNKSVVFQSSDKNIMT